MKKEQVSPAFPITIFEEQKTTVHLGIEAKDYFAAKAMQALITTYGGKFTPPQIAYEAYRFANAMLESRNL